jgi:hypothetical protein
MAITNNAVQVTWSASNSVSVTAGSNQTSDAETVTGDDCPSVTLTLKADNAGTPASGDTIDFYVEKTAGDPDGTGGNEYATQREFLAQLDTNTTDPALETVEFSILGVESWKLYAESNASSNSITVSAAGNELDLE